MRKPHKNHLEKRRVKALLHSFSTSKGIDFSESEPMAVIFYADGERKIYSVEVGNHLVISTNQGIEIENLDLDLEDVVKAAFITGAFNEHSTNLNANFEYSRRLANGDENRIMLLYKFREIEFYFTINIMGNAATITAEIKGDEDFADEVELIINNHIGLITPYINNALMEFDAS